MSVTTTMSGPIDSDQIEALPPAPTAVVKALREADGEMTTQELADETMLKQGTVSEALTRLREGGFVVSRPALGDARRRFHQLANGGNNE